MVQPGSPIHDAQTGRDSIRLLTRDLQYFGPTAGLLNLWSCELEIPDVSIFKRTGDNYLKDSKNRRY